MTKAPGPSVRRRQLGAMLRQLRHDSGHTIADAAAWLGMGESNMSKIESARVQIKVQTVRALCQLYDVDESKIGYLVQLVGESNERGWWTAYRNTVPDWFRQFVGLEADALDLWNYEAELVPGLLQTPNYVRAVTTAGQPNVTESDLAQSVELRRGRQDRIDGDHPPRLHFYISEAVIRRPLGDRDAWQEQIDHLVESSKLDHINLRVVPFSVGLHPGMLGSFVMMQFPEEEAPAFVYVEHERGATYQEDPGDTDRYSAIIVELDRLALGPEDSRVMLVEAPSQ